MKKAIQNIGKIILYILVWIKLITTPRQFLMLASVIVGIVAGVGVVALKSFAHWVFLLANYIDGILKLPYSYIILPIIGILLNVLIIHKFLEEHIEKVFSHIMYSVAKKKSILPKKQMYSQILTNSLTVRFGGSAGIEASVAITGA